MTSPDRAPWFTCLLEGPRFVYRYRNDIYQRLFGNREFLGNSVLDVLPEVVNPQFLDPLQRARVSGEPFVGEADMAMDWEGNGAVCGRRVAFTYAPVRDRAGVVTHVAVEGRLWRPPAPAEAPADAWRRDVSALSDRELLAVLLRDGGRSGATELLDRFGDLRGVLAASPAALHQAHLGHAADPSPEEPASAGSVLRLLAAGELHRRVLFQRVRERPLLSSSRRLHTYLRAVLADRPREQFRVLFLDGALRLIGDEAVGEGTLAHCAVYPREVLRRALELSAHALILVHNHPSRSEDPSQQDWRITREVVSAAACLGVQVEDHLIVAGDHVTSLRRLRPGAFVAR